MKQPPFISPAQCMQSQLVAAVSNVFQDQQRIIEEDLLSLALANGMLFNAFAAIALVPIKALDL